MALFIKQDEQRSQLQQRIATELQEKARKKALEADLPDGVEDSQFIKNTQRTKSLAWVWIVAIAVVVIAVIVFIISSSH